MVVGPLLPSSEFPEARAAAEAQAVRMARSVREAGDRAVIAPRADPDDDAVAGHESDRVLMDELPPFHRLPALLESVRDADAATAFRAWDALQKFTAADLIECDQYPQLLPALGAPTAPNLREARLNVDGLRVPILLTTCRCEMHYGGRRGPARMVSLSLAVLRWSAPALRCRIMSTAELRGDPRDSINFQGVLA